MSVTQHYMNPGSFQIPLLPTAPRGLLRKVLEFGHIYVYSQHLGQLDLFSDQTLKDGARYAGIVMEPEFGLDDFRIIGQGVEAWLGDDRDIGQILESEVALSGASASTAVAALLPDAIQPGNIVNTGLPNYTGTHHFEAPIEALRTYMLTCDAHFRVNPNCTIDVCSTDRDDVFVSTTPEVISVRKGWGHDPELVSVPARDLTTRRIAYDYVNRVIAVEGTSPTQTRIGEATRSDSYFDVHGNPVVRTKMVARPSSAEGSLATFLATELKQYVVVDEQEVSTEQFEFHRGNLAVGDMFYVYDPPSGFVDYANEVRFRGQIIWPKKERLIEATWPIARGMGIYYRPADAVVESTDWIDLTRYVAFES